MKILLAKLPLMVMLIAALSLVSCEKENLDITSMNEDDIQVEEEIVNTPIECDDNFLVEGGAIDFNTGAEAIKFEMTENNLFMVHSVDYDFFGAEDAGDKLSVATDGLPGVVFGKIETLEEGDVLDILDFPLLIEWSNSWESYYMYGTVKISEAGNIVGESIGGTIEAEYIDINGTINTVTGSFCTEIIEVSQ